jgi:hypothetical protein
MSYSFQRKFYILYIDHIGPPPPSPPPKKMCCLSSLEWLTNFEHVVQSLSNIGVSIRITPNHTPLK